MCPQRWWTPADNPHRGSQCGQSTLQLGTAMRIESTAGALGPGRSAGTVYVWQRGARTRSEPGSADPLLSISGKRVLVEERARCLLRVAAGLPLAAAWHTTAAAVCSMHTAAAASPPLAVAYCHLPLQLAAAACRCCLLLKSLGKS